MTDQNVKIVLTGDAKSLVAAFKTAGVELKGFGQESERAAKGFRQSWGELKGLAGELGLTMGLAQVVSSLKQFGAESYNAALAQKDMENALTMLVGGSAQYEDAIRQVQAATKGTISETEAARTAFGLLDNGIAKSATEAAQYARAGKAMNAAFGETASYEKFMMLLDEGSDMLLNNFNITKSAVSARQAEIQANTGLEASEARLTAIRQLALEKGLALADSVSNETMARQQATASYADFQAAFGGLISTVEQSLGVMSTATGYLNQMAEGAKAYTWILNEGIPAIKAHNAEVVNASTKAIVAAQSHEELAAAMSSGVNDFTMLRGALINSSKGYDEYIAKVDEMIQIGVENLGWTDQQVAALIASKAEYDATKTAVATETAALQAQNTVLAQNTQAMRLAGEAAYYQAQGQTAAAQAATAAAGATNAGKNAEAARYTGLAKADPMDQARTAGLTSLDVQQQAEYIVDFEKSKKAAETAAQDAKKSFQKAADDTTSAFEGAFNTVKSAVESQLSPTLDKVWKPPEGGDSFDEDAKRLATVSTSGFKSEWLNSLNTQFSGMDWWQPISAAMQSGDEGALKSAADNILLNNVSKLWDIEQVKAGVKAQLQEQNAKQQIMDTIMAELTSEGVVGAQAAAEGQSSAANAGLLGQMMGDPATVASGITTGLTPAIDGLKSSLAGLGGAAAEAGAAGEGAAGAATSGNAFGTLQTAAMTLDTYLNTTLTTTVGTLKTTLQTASADGVLQIGLITSAASNLNTGLADAKDTAVETRNKIVTGMTEGGNAITTKLIPAVVNATKAFEKMADAARAAAGAAKSAGDNAPGGGGGAAPNAKHAAGTDGWLTVPGGYPNDRYTVGLTSGEKYAVIPPGGFAQHANGTGVPAVGGGQSLSIGTIVLHGVQDAKAMFDNIQREAKARGMQFQVVS